MAGKLRLAEDLSLPIEAVTQTFAFLAKRGAGKTYTASVLAEEMLKAELPICVVDPTGVWWGLRASADGKSEGLPITVMGGEHGDVPLAVDKGELVARFIVEEGVSVVLDLKSMRKGEQIRFMTPFAETLYHLNRNPLHIFWDECDAHIPQKPMKDQLRLLGASEDIVRRGRANGLGVSLISQRAAVINKDVLTQTEVLVALRTVGPQDIAAVRAWVEQHDVHDQADEMLASLPSLPIGESWWWSPGWLNLFKQVHVRERETFNSSRTPKVGETIRAPKRLAPVDIAKLTARMAETIERAKADDPKTLRAKIQALEAELRSVRKAPPSPAADTSAVERAVAKARAAFEGSHRSAVGRWQRDGQAATAQLRKGHETLGVGLNRLSEVFASMVVEGTPASNGHTAPTATATRPAATPRAAPSPRPSGDPGTLAKGERACMSVIAQYPDGVTREQLTVTTGYKRSTRDTYLQRLAAAGYVEQRGDRFEATEAGLVALGSDYEVLPSGPELLEHYLGTLPEGERRILGVVSDAHPKPVDREAISEATGYQRSTRDTYLQRLGARRLVDAAGAGVVRLSDSLAREVDA